MRRALRRRYGHAAGVPPEIEARLRGPHKLRYEGAGKSVMGRCACGDVFLHGLQSGAPRQQIKAQYEEHLKRLESARATWGIT